MRVLDTSGDGTEDVLVRADGHLLTGVEDRRILAIDPDTGAETLVADTQGRPMGIEHHPDGGYVVCDSTCGLLHVSPDGTVSVLADGFEGTGFLFCNNAAVAAEGTIWFTDSSTRFGFEHWRGDLMEHRPTGRLFRRDPDGTTEAAGPVLPGFPDNISTGEDGNIWVAIASPRDSALDALLPRAPWLRKVVWPLREKLQPQAKALIRVLAFGPDGSLVHDIDGRADAFGKPTGVRQVGVAVWLGSFEQTTIARLDVPSTSTAGTAR